MVMFRTASSMIFPLLATHSITFRSTHLGAAANSPSSESWSLTPRKRCHQEMLALSSSNSYWASQSEFAGNSDVECFLAKQLKNNLIKGCILRTTVLKVLKDLEIDEYLNPEDSMSMNGIVGIAAPRHNESDKVINSTMPGILGYIHKCWIILIWDSGILGFFDTTYTSIVFITHLRAKTIVEIFLGYREDESALTSTPCQHSDAIHQCYEFRLGIKLSKPSGGFAPLCSAGVLLGSVFSGSVCATKPSCSAERAWFDYSPGLLSLR